VLTALVVDESPAARRQVTGLLELTGWLVHEAADAEDAHWLAASTRPDLVVTAATVPGARSGSFLLGELRATGSTARFLMVTPSPTPELRAAATAAGALACLSAPVDVTLLLDLVGRRSTEPAAEAMTDVVDLPDADLDADLMARLREVYADALPTRPDAITAGLRTGDPRAVAHAAQTLAGPSGQLGHPQVADVCQAIAAEARRGIMAHRLVAELAGMAGVDRRSGDRRTARPDAAFSGPDRRLAARRSERAD